MKDQIKKLFYVCSECTAKRFLNISQSYHQRKAVGGLTNYNDFHSCNGILQPTIISVDEHLDVRGQKRGNSIDLRANSIIPSPKPKIDEFDLEYSDEIGLTFKYISLLDLIILNRYSYGIKPDIELDEIESSTRLFKVEYQLHDHLIEYDEFVIFRLLDLLIALEIGRNVNTETISSLISFISENAKIQTDYVDKQIMIEMTSASTVWLKWQNKNSKKYLNRHGTNFLKPETIKIADRIMSHMKDGEKSLEEVKNDSDLELSSVVSIAFLLELWGLLKYEYRDQSPIQA